MCPPDISVWFACKLCGTYFLKIPDFINHKKENHFQDLIKNNCIVFEESAFSSLTEYQEHHQNKTRQISITTSSPPRGTGTVKVEISLDQDDADALPDPITTTDFDHFDDDMDFAQDNTTDSDPQTEENEALDQSQAATNRITESTNESGSDLQEVSKCKNSNNSAALALAEVPAADATASGRKPLPDSTSSSSVSKCPVCGMFIKFKSHLDVHMRKHAKEPPPKNSQRFKCPEPKCSKSFNDKASVKQHLVCHTNERPFKCSIPDCEHTFKRRSHLTAHLNNAHTLKKCLFQCPEEYCGKVLSTHASVFQHLKKVHSGGPMKKRVYTVKK